MERELTTFAQEGNEFHNSAVMIKTEKISSNNPDCLQSYIILCARPDKHVFSHKGLADLRSAFHPPRRAEASHTI